MKKHLLAIFLILLGCSLSLLHPWANGLHPLVSYAHGYVWGDRVFVYCDEGLDQSKIDLIFENEMAYKEYRDPEMVKQHLERHRERPQYLRDTFYLGGKQIDPFPYDYGKQRIVVYYDGEVVGTMGHFRTKRANVHTYTIHLKQKEDQIVLDGDIHGPDSKQWGWTKDWIEQGEI